MVPANATNEGEKAASHAAAEKDTAQAPLDEEKTTPGNEHPTDTDAPQQQCKVIEWQAKKKVWLNPSACSVIREMISKKQKLCAEFVRELQPKYAHLEDTAVNKYRGRLQIDCSALLFPRTTSLKGKFPLENFEVAFEVDDDGNVKSQMTPMSTEPRQADPEGNFDPHLFSTLNTYVSLEISIEKPLLDKKKLQPITKRVQDFIPYRPPNLKLLQIRKAAKAVYNYHDQIKDIVNVLVKKYQDIVAAEDEEERQELKDMAGDWDEEDNPLDVLRKKKLVYELNKSGAYYQFKEELKIAVIDIVREQFQQKSPFAKKSEMQNFMNEVYVYLVEQMHVALNRLCEDPRIQNGAEMDPSALQTQEELFSLKKFASDAEKNRNFDLASTFHLERISRRFENVLLWYDYACFCMRIGNLEKGEECLRYALSRNPDHVQSLLAYGVFCCNKERYNEALTFFQTAVDSNPRNILALTFLKFYYEQIEEEAEAERVHETLMKAAKNDTNTIFEVASQFLINIQADALAERVFAEDLFINGQQVRPYLNLAKLKLQKGEFAKVEENVKKALDIRQDDPDAWVMLGHAHYFRDQCRDAKSAYETVLSLAQEPEDITLIYLRLGKIYLETSSHNDLKMAKTMYLRACEAFPSSQSWLGVGVSCMQMNQYEEAEDALSEATVLSNREADIWGYLALLYLKTKRTFEANQALKQGLIHGIKNTDLLRELAELFMDRGSNKEAAECLRLSLSLKDDVKVRELFVKCILKYVDEADPKEPLPDTIKEALGNLRNLDYGNNLDSAKPAKKSVVV